MPRTRLGRRLAGAAAVVAACLISVFSARGLQKPDSTQAPDYRKKGDPAAPVVIIEYSDFQCPACRAAETTLQTMLTLYGRDAFFIYKHYPLEDHHAWARLAAAASECAGRQEGFWAYHDALYENQSLWSKGGDPTDKFLQYARQLGLKEADFKSCLKDPSVNAAIDTDIQEGDERWVGSTPTFFINRRRFVGSRQLSASGAIWIEKLLRGKREAGS